MKIVDYSNIQAAEMTRQTTNTILMVRPANFGFNAETAESNAFQKWDTTLSQREISQKAIAEFDAFVKELMDFSGINIEVNISPDIAILPITGISRHTNLFRIFKEVCLMIDASVVFNTNNTVDIESRKSKINEFRKQEVIKLTDKDITSIESSEQI